jgi:hypothetical protein
VVVPKEVESSEPGVDVQPSTAERVVVIPERGRGLVVYVIVVLLLKLRAGLLEVPREPRLRLAVARMLDVSTVKVGHDPHSGTVVGNRATVYRLIDRQEMLVWQFVLPAHGDWFTLLGLDRPPRVLAVVPPDSRRGKVGVNLLFNLTHFHLVIGTPILRLSWFHNTWTGDFVEPLLDLGRRMVS